MASNAGTVARSIRVFADNALSPAARSAFLAKTAKRARDDVIRRGDAPNAYDTVVDGRRGAAEETVRPDGAILYRFNLLGAAAALALSYCVARSPNRKGDFRKSWMVIVNGARWTRDLDEIPADATVMVTNPRPQARKVESGHMRMSVPHGIIEEARQQVIRRFPRLEAEKLYVTIPAALGGGYILKGHFRKGARQFSRTKLKSDTSRGALMTYPALEISGRR